MNPSNEFFLIEHRLRKIFIGDVAKQTTLDKKDDSMFVKWRKDWDSKNHQIITWIDNISIPTIHFQLKAFDNVIKLWDFHAKPTWF